MAVEKEYRELSKKCKESEELMNELKRNFNDSNQFGKVYTILLKLMNQVVKSQINEEKKKAVKELEEKCGELRKENAKLKEKTIQKNKEWKEKYEELKEENTKLKGKYEELEKQNGVFKETERKYRSCQIKYFLELQEKLWEIDERDYIYEEFFNDSVLPLQILMGLDREMDLQTEERINYYIWDVIIEPLAGVMKKRGGELQNGKLVLPKQEGIFERERIAKKIEQESLDQIERYIKEDERRVELKAIVLQKKGVVEDLGRMLEELNDLVKVHRISKKEIGRLAKEARILLERNGIYPMFAEELREYPNEELKKRMIPVNPNSIKYPGLFIKRDDGLEVFGTNIGMDDYE